jgi:hypothetical protein
MAGTKTEKQTKAQRLKDVYESMSDSASRHLKKKSETLHPSAMSGAVHEDASTLQERALRPDTQDK